jgi:hypothetical protein
MFVPRRFLSPPREFKNLFGKELRQTRIDSYFVGKKMSSSRVSKAEFVRKLRQSRIESYFVVKKR